MGTCKDCIYAKPTTLEAAESVQKCSWNHRCHSPNYECEIHSFFPKKRQKVTDNEIQKFR